MGKCLKNRSLFCVFVHTLKTSFTQNTMAADHIFFSMNSKERINWRSSRNVLGTSGGSPDDHSSGGRVRMPAIIVILLKTYNACLQFTRIHVKSKANL